MSGDDKTRSFAALTKDTLVHQYRIHEKIGAGGMGEVYLAEDTRLKRRVALKFLPTQFCSDTKLTARFLREAEAAAKLNHPNIITVYDVDEFGGRPFIAMELVEGLSLRELAKVKELDLKQVIELAIQACEGLEAAHAKQIVHRDIKPGNIVIDAYGRPKILDFGLAAIQSDERLTKSGSTLGTIRYMSPEQVRGEQVDHRSDLYSLGVVLYELITGRSPFQKDNEAATLRAITNDPVEPLSRYKAGVPAALEELVVKLMEKQVDLRFQSASGVAAELKRIRRQHFGENTESVEVIRQERGPARKKSGRSKMIFSGSLITVLIAAALVLKPWNISIETSQEAIAAPENSLAALYIENVADPEDAKSLGRMILSLLITDLSATGHIKVVSRQRLFDIVGSLGESPGMSLDATMASKVAKKANVKWVLAGEILRIDPEFVVSAEISDPATGAILGSHTVQGLPDDDVFAIVDKLSDKILASFSSRIETIPASRELDEDTPVATVTTDSPEAYNFYLDALEFQRKHYNDEASERLQEAVKLDSTFAMAHLALSLSPASIETKREAIERAYRYIDRVTPREKLWILAIRAELTEPPEYDKAIEHLEKVIEKYPEDLDAYVYLSVFARAVDDYPRALNYLEQALEVDPNFKSAHNSISYTYYELGELDKAFWAANEYVRLAPEEANSYDTRGELYARTGRFDKAVADFKRALENKPGFFTSRRGMMSACILSRDFNDHNYACQLFLDSESKYCRSGARLMRGIALEAQAKFAEAEEAFRQGIGADILDDANKGSFYYDKFMRRVKIDWWIHDDPAGIEATASESVLMENPYLPLVYRLYAQTMRKDTSRARELMGEYNQLRVDSGLSIDTGLNLYFEWMMAFKMEDYAAAVDKARRTFETSGTYRSRVRLGITYVLNNQPEKAVELLTIDDWDDFEDYAKRPILYALSRYYLGRAYEQSAWSDKAAKEYKEFLELWGDGDAGIEEIDDARKRLARLAA